MPTYVLKRLASAALIVWGVLTLTFLIVHAAPGDPSWLYIKPEIDPASVANIRRQMGFDLPIWQQYLRWLHQTCAGNFGVSFAQHRPVNEILAEAVPNTLQLTVVVFVVQLILGTLVGVITALKRNSWLDRTISGVMLVLYSVPGFWLALMAVLVFSLKLGWLPSSQMRSFQDIEGFMPQVWDRVRHLILPGAILSAPFIAYTSRFVRGSLCEVLGQDYIRTARAYGLGTTRLLFKYAMKNALLPLVTLTGLYLPFLFGGAVITETVFAWPGMGRITVDSIFAHDYPVILASTFIAAATVVIGNLISDVLYFAVDPRIRVQGRA